MIDAALSEKRRLAALPVSEWVAERLTRLPRRLAESIRREHERRAGVDSAGERGANLWLLATLARLPLGGADLAATDGEIVEQAARRAAYCREMKTRRRPLAELNAYCVKHGASIPEGKEDDEAPKWARASCERWWRRQMRGRIARAVEGVNIDAGRVHKYAGLYCSDDTLWRRKRQRARNAELLAAMVAVNEEGQKYTLAELAELGTSNKTIRRAELMTRSAGFELIARGLGHAAEFYTFTCPSKFHARHHHGAENENYQPGLTPLEAQRYLIRVWAGIRAELARKGIKLYGFRTVEPHHDGTPHWHTLFFMEPRHVDTVRAVMRRHALKEDGDEKGAQERRFTVKAINYEEGTATGYIAKYISKNIDGENAHGDSVGDDDEALPGTDVKDSVKRVDAWASCWGLRQFQQIGGPPVTIWRELRRVTGTEQSREERLGAALWRELRGLEPLEMTVLDKAAEAADAGRWNEFVRLMGGPVVARCDLPLALHKINSGKPNRYGEQADGVIKGVVDLEAGAVAISRVHEWVLERSGAAASSSSAFPRTRVNNCTDSAEDVCQPQDIVASLADERGQINTGRPIDAPEAWSDDWLDLLDDIDLIGFEAIRDTWTAIANAGDVESYVTERMSAATDERRLITSLKTGRAMTKHWFSAGLAGLQQQNLIGENASERQSDQAGAGRRRAGAGQPDERQDPRPGVRTGNGGDRKNHPRGTRAPEQPGAGAGRAVERLGGAIAGARAWLKGI